MFIVRLTIGITIHNSVVVYVVVDGSRCKRGDGTIQEADLADDLVVDGEMYGSVETF